VVTPATNTSWRRWGRHVAVAAQVAAGLGSTQAGLMFAGLRNEPEIARFITFPRVLAWQVLGWLPWALIAPTILAAGAWFPPRRRVGWVLGHLVAAVAASAVLSLGTIGANVVTRPFGKAVPTDSRPKFSPVFFSSLPLHAVSYFALLGGGYAFDLHRRLREREVRAAQLESRLANARLEALRLQIHPHFLFNTLHTAAGLVRQGESTAAVETLSRLADLLRVTVDGEGRQLVPLAEELRVADLYLEIQAARFADRLRVERSVDPALLATTVPSFVLQPLLENAIRHGIGVRAGVATLWLVARAGADGRVLLEVQDDGVGLQAASGHDPAGNGEQADAAAPRDGAAPGLSGFGRAPGDSAARRRAVGLANVRDRLQQIYGGAAALELLPRPGGGTVARLSLPPTAGPVLEAT
jgi:two-component system LytT family sensor kinase